MNDETLKNSNTNFDTFTPKNDEFRTGNAHTTFNEPDSDLNDTTNSSITTEVLVHGSGRQPDTAKESQTRLYPDLPQQEVKVLPQMWLTDSDEEIQQSPLQYSQSTLTDSDNIWRTSSPRIQLILSTNQETSLNESKSSRPKWLTRCIDRLLRPFKRRQGHHRR